jgi:hypothetical protein
MSNILEFEFDWKDVKGTRFYLNEHDNTDWYVLVWITEDEETLINAWLLQPIYDNSDE